MNRCINDYYEKINNDKIIEEDDIRALIDSWIYGTATPMIALINALHKTYNYLSDGRKFLYRNKNKEILELRKDNFEIFILHYFDEFTYNSVIDDFNQNKYR